MVIAEMIDFGIIHTWSAVISIIGMPQNRRGKKKRKDRVSKPSERYESVAG